VGRVLILARSQLAGEWLGEKGARLPIAPILFQVTVTALLCAVVRDALGPYPYALFALAVTLGLTAIPLLGELGPLLRADPAAEWVGALPVRAFDLRASRVLVIGVLLGGLALGCLLPAAALAPGEVGLLGRGALVLGGLAQTAVLAAALLLVQALLGERAEALLLLVQTAVFCGVLVGLLVGLAALPELAAVDAPRGALLALPPAWFATPLLAAPLDTAPLAVGLALGALAAAAVTLACAPFPPAPRARRSASAMSFLLAPVRAVATRFWVRRDERAVFDLVYDALPNERDFVARTYPLVAAPLAFLLLGAEPDTARGQGLFALLLFAPAIYLPVLLLFVPTTATPPARWLLDTAPLDRRSEAAGAQKAVAVRFLVPLYVGLAGLTIALGTLELALRLTPPAAILSLWVLRSSWELFVARPPLSTPAADLGSVWKDSNTNAMMLVAVVATLLGLAAWQWLSLPASFALAVAVLTLEVARARRATPAAG
jgi:hypothetical protein